MAKKRTTKKAPKKRKLSAAYVKKAVAVYKAVLKDRKYWPKAQFGTAHIPRGTPWGEGAFGRTWKTADANQRASRQSTGWYGNGLYVNNQ